jgi:hypothetical protein
MSTMYRKRDKYSKQGSAVALLVGREERGLGEEQVIEVLFDREKMGGEEACSDRWIQNEGRFSSPRIEDEVRRGDDGRVVEVKTD